jgi:hypothetical protein
LPGNLRAEVEYLSGLSLDGVRVHRDSDAPAKVGALAYALGGDIHLGPGQERHLPHEAWHVVQQAQGRVRPTLQAMGARAVAVIAAESVRGFRSELVATPPGAKVVDQPTSADLASHQKQGVDSLLRTASVNGPIQRIVTINDLPQGFSEILTRMTVEQRKSLGTSSKLLKKWADQTPDETYLFESVLELHEELMRLQSAGRAAQEVGRKREKDAAGNSDPVPVEGPRGQTLYNVNGVTLSGGYKGQDPTLQHPNGGVVKLDIHSDDDWGLVGGPAKAKDDEAVNKELGRLSVLAACCQTDGKHRAVVRYEGIKRDEKEFNPRFDRLIQGALKRGITVFINGIEITEMPDDSFYNRTAPVPVATSASSSSSTSSSSASGHK